MTACRDLDTERGEEFTAEEARSIWETIGTDWRTVRFDPEQFRMTLGRKAEDRRRDATTNVSAGVENSTRNMVWPHQNESDGYFTRLAAMTDGVVRAWSDRKDDGQRP
jgi:hypothetical protein